MMNNDLTWINTDSNTRFAIIGSYQQSTIEVRLTNSDHGLDWEVEDSAKGTVATGNHPDASIGEQIAVESGRIWLRSKINGVKPSWSYVGRKWCGCIVAAYVEDENPKNRKSLAKEVAKWIGSYGLTVDRMLSEAVRVEWVGAECDHGKEPGDQMRLFDDERR
jgi:hypothetical protein